MQRIAVGGGTAGSSPIPGVRARVRGPMPHGFATATADRTNRSTPTVSRAGCGGVRRRPDAPCGPGRREKRRRPVPEAVPARGVEPGEWPLAITGRPDVSPGPVRSRGRMAEKMPGASAAAESRRKRHGGAMKAEEETHA